MVKKHRIPVSHRQARNYPNGNNPLDKKVYYLKIKLSRSRQAYRFPL